MSGKLLFKFGVSFLTALMLWGCGKFSTTSESGALHSQVEQSPQDAAPMNPKIEPETDEDLWPSFERPSSSEEHENTTPDVTPSAEPSQPPAQEQAPQESSQMQPPETKQPEPLPSKPWKKSDSGPYQKPPPVASPTPAPEAKKPTEPRENPAPRTGALDSKDIVESGVIKPTIYYFPIIQDNDATCAAADRKKMHNDQDQVIFEVCSKTLSACALQGSCVIDKNGKTTALNIKGRSGDHERFFVIPEEGCQFGYGVKSSCLDPFFTLAADLSIYKPGDVIYVPAVVGALLPDGSKHNGFFVIRDSGRKIKGRGRFDFFSGYFHWRDSNNPFNKLGLTSKKTNVPYYQVKGDRRDFVLSDRAYPGLPRKAIKMNPRYGH